MNETNRFASDPRIGLEPAAWRIALEVLMLACIMIAVPLLLYLDFVLIGVVSTEESMTEVSHNLLLIGVIVAIGTGIYRYPDQRRYLLVLITFFMCLLVRESDAMFDLIHHGFWVYPVLAVLVIGGVLIARAQGEFRRPMLRHLQTRDAAFILIGLLSLLIFTRLLGTGSLWEPIMQEAYDPRFKSVLQEGLELFSYALIAYGTCLSLMNGFASRTISRNQQ